MPKRLPNLQEAFLEQAKHILYTEGYGALSIRRLAVACHTATGTVYNYFRNKDELVAQVMMADWRKALLQMEKAAETAAAPAEGMSGLYQAISAFVTRYQSIWNQYAQSGGSGGVVASHHAQLRGQVARQLEALFSRTADPGLLPLTPLIAETLLAAAVQPDLDEAMLLCLTNRLYSKPQTKG